MLLDTYKHLLALTLVFAVVACGDDDDDTTDNTPTPTPSLQQQALDNGQITFADSSAAALSATTLAVSGVSPAQPATALPASAGWANPNADFYGAVDPSAATPWYDAWTYRNSSVEGNLPGGDQHPLEDNITPGTGQTITAADTMDSGCMGLGFTDSNPVMVFGQMFPVCVIDANITADVSLPNNHIFLLASNILVGDGEVDGATEASVTEVTLTIAPGTQIYSAEQDNVQNSPSLVITRGSKIQAPGTADMPIIFGAVAVDDNNNITGDVTDLNGRGDWGGLVINGFGINNKGTQVKSEASPVAVDRFFAGTNNADDSGTLTYAIIAETGVSYQEDAEVQGLTLEAVGSGTTIRYIQVVQSDDDCVEWFGGAVNTSYIVCNGVTDDGLDIDQAYVGAIQFAIVRIGASSGERGIESDGNNDAGPFTQPNIANVTVLGNAGRTGATSSGALHRENFQGKVYRSVFMDDTAAGAEFEGPCVDVDNVLPAELTHRDSVFSCAGGVVSDTNDDE